MPTSTTHDVLITGAGMTGAVAAAQLAAAGANVLVIDQRDHVGGNCYDAPDEHGVCIHPYGPHIFHTSKAEVVEFLSAFTAWRPYEHRVCALINHRIVPLPFNLTSLRLCFTASEAAALEAALVEAFGAGAQIPILELRRTGRQDLTELADFIYEHVFVGYTQKQWGLAPDAIDPAITGRVPVRVNHDDRYFTDTFQRMPLEGFTPLFGRMLRHERITVRTSTPYAELGDAHGHPCGPAHNFDHWKCCIHTGPLDEFFHSTLGALPYRSLRFDFAHYAQPRHLPVGVLNYPDARVPWTRIAEYKTLTGQETAGTSVSVEYALPHEPGRTIPYYPVLTKESATLLHAYEELAAMEAPGVIFAGRLGAFRYYNMDDAVLAGMEAATRALRMLRG